MAVVLNCLVLFFPMPCSILGAPSAFHDGFSQLAKITPPLRYFDPNVLLLLCFIVVFVLSMFWIVDSDFLHSVNDGFSHKDCFFSVTAVCASNKWK